MGYTSRVSAGKTDGRRLGALRAAAAGALVLVAGPLFAALTEVPPVDAPIGSGVSNSAPAAVNVRLAAPLAISGAPAAFPSLPSPAAVAAPVTAAPAAASPAAVPAAAPALTPAAAGSTPSRAAASAAGGGGRAGGGAGGVGASGGGFDLSGESAGAASALAAPADLPSNAAGKILARLRRAGESGPSGPGAIPGISGAKWAGQAGSGLSGETHKVLIGGKTWFLKRLGPSPDPGIDALPKETRARNEIGAAAVLRSDPQLSKSFSVSPRVSVFRDGKDVFVLSEGLPSLGDGESRRQELSGTQRADAAIIQLVLGLGDMHGGDVLPLGGGRFGLVDFEKLSRAPLEKASPQRIDEEVMLKNFPLVDRLSENEPASYRARYQEWRKEYDAGGRARMDAALAEAGWSRPQREVYLAAVDRNLETYLERLEPYLEYANAWHRRILAARAEAARKDAAPRKGFFSGLFGSR